ncbi:MAG: gamma-glutamyl-gamma-aminobutyrate hydrolase family protein [Clostridia bacterium]|nr:gamma-glutamyl-gamma-aminobutyrate hydrolase family protein [Clostridia bacterium]
MKKPRILMTAYKEQEKNLPYIRAVEEAGGEAVCLYAPPVDLSFDGLLLCGGEDVAPALYGEEVHGTEKTDPERDEAELALARAYVEYGKPVFGICRGAQLLNVALGGSLWQHLRTTADHRAPEGELMHAVRAEAGSLLWDLYDSNFLVNSYHHQALRLPGCGVVPTAWAQDGTVEGFEHERLPLLGVQWHPERILHGEGGSAPGLPLFRYFLCLCGEAGSDLHAPVQRDPDVRFACGILDEE